MYLAPFTPTIIIRKMAEDKYGWFLYLSPNKDRPSCTAPIVYSKAFKARESALEFARKLKGPLKVRDRVLKSDELIDTTGAITIIDETKKHASKPVVTDTL